MVFSFNIGKGCFYYLPTNNLLADCYHAKSISSGAQYVTLRKYFSHPSLVMYSFATSRIKLKLGQQFGGGLLIANHLDQLLWWANQKHISEHQLDHIYYTLFCRCTAVLRLLPATATSAIMLSQNHFRGPNWHMLDFLHPILMCRIAYWAPLEML
jgi:hypothetical protein